MRGMRDTTSQFGDFSVQSVDLNEQCAAAGDPRCLPSGPHPIASPTGQVNRIILIYEGANVNNYPTPFNLDQQDIRVDNPFRSPSGNEPSFNMCGIDNPIPDPSCGTTTNEPGAGNVVNPNPHEFVFVEVELK